MSRFSGRRLALSVPLAAVLLLALGLSASADVPNPEFNAGDQGPTEWSLSGGNGRWVDRQILEVTGNGNDSNYWRSDCRFTPGALYHFRVRGRGTPSSGSAIAGPAFANRDYHAPSKDWTWVSHVFRVPDNVRDSYLRLGQWHALGTIQFDAVRLDTTLPVHKSADGLLLGEGETIQQGRYTFSGTFAHPGSNYHRTLDSATAGFNSDRWCFDTGSQVTYRFGLPGQKFTSGDVTFNVNYHTRGACVADVSLDGTNWQPLLTQPKVGTAQAALPAEMLPAETVYVRLRPGPQGGSFQVNQVDFTATLNDTRPDATGQTAFADIASDGDEAVIREITLDEGRQSGRVLLHLKVHNPTQETVTATLRAQVRPVSAAADNREAALKPQEAELAPGGLASFDLDLPAQQPGEHQARLDLDLPGISAVKATLSLSVPDYYRSDYGARIEGISGDTAVWWCDAAHKIAPQRGLPTASSPAARLSAAGNDFEAVQIVVRPQQALNGLTATATPLGGPQGATIPAENVRILRVAYHFVDHPTDGTGVRDWWPDALPPLAGPIDVPAGKNQPLWVLVHVPVGAKAGDYAGKVSLRADGFSADVPLKLHVWDFALPERNHIETAFGFSPGNVFRYHQLKTDEDKRRVLEMYLRCFAEHRISPYDPTPMDSIGVKFLPEADPPRAQLDTAAFDRAMTRAVEEHHFTGIRLPIQGMGGGTFHARYEPKIGRFGEGTPEYQAMFSSYVKQLESHLRQQGWLEMAYIYWFDEPDPKDYEFVANGMKRLNKYAPGLRRMLTEEPGENVLCGNVDIWCPVSFNYNHEAAQKRRAQGERFWWYVCCGPKAPYCTLFIDHPATELRTWLWQTWQRDVVGVLVWSSNYWTSSAAFPEAPQNPYEDPMGYVSGYSTPRGTKRYWGNGDGRFIYPPESAAAPGLRGPEPIIEPPVSSIRWEMLREGIEDYEMLYLLRELLAKHRDGLSPEQVKQYEALLTVPESITKDMTIFNTDPKPIYTRRAEIAEAIEELGRSRE